MNSLALDFETSLRLSVFFSVFLFMAMLEILIPRRKLSVSKTRRWLSNISISFLNTMLARIAIPLAGAGAALLAQERNWGLLNHFDVPGWLGVALFLLLFDLTIYFQHRVFHLVPVLWRLHRVHHTDPDYDVTTGNRFHPFSILLSSVIKLSLILAIGPLVISVVIAEVLLNATAMFNHSNIRIPARFDKYLRLFVVTPDMHRIHHSVDAAEHNSNFGFNFPWWDRLFGTYLDQAKTDQQTMDIGIGGFEGSSGYSVSKLIIQPLRNPK